MTLLEVTENSSNLWPAWFQMSSQNFRSVTVYFLCKKVFEDIDIKKLHGMLEKEEKFDLQPLMFFEDVETVNHLVKL